MLEEAQGVLRIRPAPLPDGQGHGDLTKVPSLHPQKAD